MGSKTCCWFDSRVILQVVTSRFVKFGTRLCYLRVGFQKLQWNLEHRSLRFSPANRCFILYSGFIIIAVLARMYQQILFNTVPQHSIT